MHYKKHKGNRAKIPTSQFCLNAQILEEIQRVAKFDNQSFSIVAECALLFYFKGDLENARKKSYKKRKVYKKNLFTQRRLYKIKKRIQKVAYEQKSIFENGVK